MASSGDASHDLGRRVTGVLLVGLGAVGTLCRHGLDRLIGEAAGLPAGILIVNITGALLLGILLEALALRGADRGGLRLLLGTGVLGGYTSYSVLAGDVAGLVLDGRITAALGYGVGSIVLGVLAAWAGILLARGLGHRPRTGVA